MKPRNTIMALIAKNDPTRYHSRAVEDEQQKLQKNRSRRKSEERKEICNGMVKCDEHYEFDSLPLQLMF